MDKYVHHIIIRFQSIICATSYQNTRSFIRNLFNRIKLCKKYFMVDWHIGVGSARIPHRIRIHHERIQKAVRRLFIMCFKNFLTDTTFFRCSAEHLFIIQLDSEIICDLIPDLPSCTSELSSYCNNRVRLHITPRSFCLSYS